ncbi:MAG: ComEA family DNA-binding protein [Chloroflexi bacterium]|nr:MAG: ComEA family DNA-binding protein [Chloroflexota bacterium]RLT33858.1 MAG: ComEA family DNA-binding protein [Chloroflexota bacterium]
MRQIVSQRVAAIVIWVVLIAGVLLVTWFVVAPKTVIDAPVVPEDPPVTQFKAAPEVEPTALPSLVVYVTGAVAHPGLYALATHERVGAAVAAAGGLTADADYQAVNMAEHITDGQHINIPPVTEPTHSGPSTVQPTEPQQIAINTATAAELEQLPGVGASMAERIVAYRTQHGPFKTLADLDAVSGIGGALLERLQPHVRF